MGIHFVNLTIQGPPDPTKPNVLIYEPVGDKLKLVAAEWLVPLAVAKERPMLLGQPFQGPMEGHEPLIPQRFHHYDLHAWLFKDNPNRHVQPHQSQRDLQRRAVLADGNADKDRGTVGCLIRSVDLRSEESRDLRHGNSGRHGRDCLG